MSGHRNCAVFDCGNSGARLKKWMSIPCSVHECNQGTSQCDCAPPFTLFPFPTQLHDRERRQQWIKLVNRKDEKGRNWQPKSDSRICSNHFPEGRPTIQNPNLTINLGCKSVANSKKERKRPLVRETTPLTKRACPEKSLLHCPMMSHQPLHILNIQTRLIYQYITIVELATTLVKLMLIHRLIIIVFVMITL